MPPVTIKKSGMSKAQAKTTVTEHNVPVTKDETVSGFEGLYDDSKPEASVRVALGLTKNLGDFNSARFDVAISIPCNPGTVESAYTAAVQWCDEKVDEIQSGLDSQ